MQFLEGGPTLRPLESGIHEIEDVLGPECSDLIERLRAVSLTQIRIYDEHCDQSPADSSGAQCMTFGEHCLPETDGCDERSEESAEYPKRFHIHLRSE